jgi:cell division protein FtsL
LVVVIVAVIVTAVAVAIFKHETKQVLFFFSLIIRSGWRIRKSS